MKDERRNDYHNSKGHSERRPNSEQTQKDKKKKRRRRKRRLIFWLIVLLILIGIVLGLLYGGKLGLGDGLGFLPGVSADKNGGTQGGGEDENQSQANTENQPTSVATITPEPTKEAEGAPAPDAYITVSEDKIYLNSTELSLEGLKAQLENAYKGAKVTLTDDYAIKDAYESVTGLLSELGISEYEEKKAD